MLSMVPGCVTERNNICVSLRCAITNTQSEIDMLTADLAAM